MTTKIIIRSAIIGYLSTRCDVTSQHKLPGREEIRATIFAGLLGRDEVLAELDRMISEGRLILYGGCYISDRTIDVL